LHVPAISFDTSAYTYPLRSLHNHNGNAVVCGGSCLILAMVALNALHDFEQIVERDLLKGTKKPMLDYLDERRKARPSAAFNKSSTANESIKKPTLWGTQGIHTPLILMLIPLPGLHGADLVHFISPKASLTTQM
jgi:hypothetical protein